MPVIDLQRRGQQIGRIRIGQQVTAANGKTRPAKLDTFRFTTQSRPSADAIAALYGGQVREWNGQWEVITRESAIGVTVPPRDQVVSQWYEMWTKGGCQRRCDSRTEQRSGKPCLCPHASDPGDEDEVARAAAERAMLASRNPPQACKLVTRISVMIPDLPGLGVFRLDTGSYYAGVEIGDAAALMELARDKGVFLPAILRIEQRQRVADGQTKNYPVPVLEVLATFRQIATGQLKAAGVAAQLPPPAAGAPKAIEAPEPPEPEPPAGEDPEYAFACRIAAEGAATTSSARFRELAEEAKAGGVMDTYVCADPAADEWVPLGVFLEEEWRRKAAAAKGAASGD